ncbi:MAG: hypothetical protein H6Q73_3362 [Firmicutes bacterium]|nr:hypothetical protein [Bacillota bacterium]
MYCPLLCSKPDNTAVSFGQCMEEACAWWISSTEKCAICELGVYAGNQSEA